MSMKPGRINTAQKRPAETSLEVKSQSPGNKRRKTQGPVITLPWFPPPMQSSSSSTSHAMLTVETKPINPDEKTTTMEVIQPQQQGLIEKFSLSLAVNQSSGQVTDELKIALANNFTSQDLIETLKIIEKNEYEQILNILIDHYKESKDPIPNLFRIFSSSIENRLIFCIKIFLENLPEKIEARLGEEKSIYLNEAPLFLKEAPLFFQLLTENLMNNKISFDEFDKISFDEFKKIFRKFVERISKRRKFDSENIEEWERISKNLLKIIVEILIQASSQTYEVIDFVTETITSHDIFKYLPPIIPAGNDLAISVYLILLSGAAKSGNINNANHILKKIYTLDLGGIPNLGGIEKMCAYNNYTPLMWACKNADIEMVKCLLNYRINIFQNFNLGNMFFDTSNEIKIDDYYFNAITVLVQEMDLLDKEIVKSDNIDRKKSTLFSIFKLFIDFSNKKFPMNQFSQNIGEREFISHDIFEKKQSIYNLPYAFKDDYSLLIHFALKSAIKVKSASLIHFFLGSDFLNSIPQTKYLILHLALIDAIYFDNDMELIKKLMEMGATKETMHLPTALTTHNNSIRSFFSSHVKYNHLNVAVLKGRLDVVKLLLDKGFELLLDPTGRAANYTPSTLDVAFASGQLDILNFLISENVLTIPYKAPHPFFKTVLMHAAENGHNDCVIFLIGHVRKNFSLEDLKTMLNEKFTCRDHDERYRKEDSAFSALSLAASNGHIDVVKSLLSVVDEQGRRLVEINPVDTTTTVYSDEKIDYPLTGATPLLQSIQNKHYKIANLLLDAGANPNVCSDNGLETPLYLLMLHNLKDPNYKPQERAVLISRFKELKANPDYCPRFAPGYELSTGVQSTPFFNFLIHREIYQSNLSHVLIETRAHLNAGVNLSYSVEDPERIDPMTGKKVRYSPILDFLKSSQCRPEIQSLVNEFIKERKKNFLAGTHIRVGQQSSVYRGFRQSSLGEERLFSLIFGFLVNEIQLDESPTAFNFEKVRDWEMHRRNNRLNRLIRQYD